MPILATLTNRSFGRAQIVVDERRLDFESLDGNTFTFDTDAFILSGTEGIDVAPREVTETDGGSGLPRLSQIRDLPADMMLPLLLTAPDYRGNLRQLKRLRAMFNYRTVDYKRTDGTFDLVATDAGQTRRRRCFYKSGLEGEYSEDSRGTGWLMRGLELRSVWSPWRGPEWSTGEIRIPKPRPFLSNDPAHPFGSLALSASLVLGAPMPVFVGGDIPSPAVIEMHGPFTSATVTSNSGLSFKVGALGPNDYMVIDTGRDRRAELNGGGINSGSALIGRGAQWLPILPGGAEVTVAIVGAEEETYVVVHGETLFESPWATEDA